MDRRGVIPNPIFEARRDKLAWAASFVVGALVGSTGVLIASDPIGRALWCLAGVVMLLPMAMPARAGVDWKSYLSATAPVVLITILAAGFRPAAVVASVALSLIGMLALLVRIGIPCAFAIGLLLVQSVLFLAWPVWTAHLLLKFDSQRLVDLLVNVGPVFAINASIDPTDAITHRPLAYRLMNLGQDLPYTMPRSVWRCVIVHTLAGVPGILAMLWKREQSADQSTHSPR